MAIPSQDPLFSPSFHIGPTTAALKSDCDSVTVDEVWTGKHVLRNTAQAVVAIANPGTSLLLHLINTDNPASFAVWADGVHLQDVDIGAIAVGEDVFARVAIPAGAQMAEIWEPVQDGNTGTPNTPPLHGGYVLDAYGAGTLTTLTSTQRGAYLTDSIWSGQGASIKNVTGMFGLTRAAVRGSARVSIAGFGGRALVGSGYTVGQMATDVTNLLFSASQKYVWIALITNDHLSNTCTPAVFGATAGSLMDAIHAIDSSIHIFWGGPFSSTKNAAANGGGFTMPQYDTALQSAISTRTSFAQYVDQSVTGAGWPAAGRFGDGLHPDDLGHSQAAAAATTVRVAAGFA